MNKILISIDYNPSSQKIAEQGYKLGKAQNAEIILIHVVEDVMYYSSQSYDPIMGFGGFVNTNLLDTEILQSVKDEALIFLEKTKIHLNDTHILVEVLHGNILEQILDKAKKEKCDLIVIGTHSRNAIEEIVLGSTAHKLIKNSNIPIFIVPIKH